MTAFQSHNPLEFELMLPVEEPIYWLFEELVTDIMGLPRGTVYDELKPHQKTTWNRTHRGVLSGYLWNEMWTLDEVHWLSDNEIHDYEIKVSTWLFGADESILLRFHNANDAMRFKLAFVGT